MAQTISLPAAVFLLIVYLIFRFVFHHFRRNKQESFWSSHPILGLDGGPFSLIRATLKSVQLTRKRIFDGYSKYSKVNSFFVVPTLDRGRILVVPPRQVKKLYSLPENVLDVTATGNESIQTKWTIGDEDVYANPLHMHVVRNQITKNLDILTPIIASELEQGFVREWGTSKTEWKSISVWGSCLDIVAGAANAAFCGTPLCQDMEFLKRLQSHATCLFLGAVFINATPKPLRFVTGYTVSWTSHFLFKRVLKVCLPYVKDRLYHIAMLKASPGYVWTPPKDGLQWLIDECYATGDSAQLDPKRIAHRLCFMNDISMHSTGYTARNVIIDLANADPSLGYLDALREEAGRVLKEANGTWTRQAVLKLKLIDSTVRESMRMTTFFSVGLPRTVVDPHGVSVGHGDSTFTVPKGTTLALPVEAIHYDEDIYPDAKTFNPYRFTDKSMIRDIVDETASKTHDGKAQEHGSKPDSAKPPKASATIDDSFLSFGFGKHACPGRFFALNEVKVMVAHMVLNYDIQLLRRSDRNKPKNMPVIWLNVPPLMETKIRVRRRTPLEAM